MKKKLLIAIAILFCMSVQAQDNTKSSKTHKHATAHHKKHRAQSATSANTNNNSQMNKGANTTGSANGTMPNNPDPGKVTTNPNKGPISNKKNGK